jgi:hypothetical protein
MGHTEPGSTRRRDPRTKVIEWIRRYLPLEIAGWVGELGAAGIAYAGTGSLAMAAVAATIGSSIGYYLPAYVNAFRWTWPTTPSPVASLAPTSSRTWLGRVAITKLLALRSLTMEFGIAEVIDSALVRPALIFAAPVLLDHVLLGWIVGGFIADATFYVVTIFSYEKFKRWLARRPEPVTIAEPEPVLP